MKDKDLDMIISELEHTNRFLYELNKNLANLVFIHQVQLAAVEKALKVPEEVIEIPEKKLH
jgi:predicted GTPase